MGFCGACGKKADSKDKFCTSCGVPITEAKVSVLEETGEIIKEEYRQSTAPPDAELAAGTHIVNKKGKKGRVMIADDSDAIRHVLKYMISLWKHELVGEATDGAEAVEKFNTLKPDLLLLDLTMPEKDGLTVLKEIKGANPDAKIIVLSGADTKEEINRCLEAGAFSFIPKPFDLDQVAKIFEEI